MAKQNGFWANIKRFQVLIWIAIALIGVISFFLTMGSDIDHNTENITKNTLVTEKCKSDVIDVRRIQAVMQKEVENIGEDVKEIKVEQRTMRKDMADRLDRIYEKVK